MKHQWKIQRGGKEYSDGQNRWDRAYQLVLEIARFVEETQTQMELDYVTVFLSSLGLQLHLIA
jgi:hypothetical protein